MRNLSTLNRHRTHLIGTSLHRNHFCLFPATKWLMGCGSAMSMLKILFSSCHCARLSLSLRNDVEVTAEMPVR